MKRREFTRWIRIGLMALTWPMAIAACQGSSSTSEENNTPDSGASDGAASSAADSAPQTDDFTAVGTVADLDEQGVLSDRTFPAGPIAVIRDPSDTSGVIAASALCTHQQCRVDWRSDGQVFSCPCHGSKFGPEGSVIEGPATEPLEMFAARVEGDTILVQNP